MTLNWPSRPAFPWSAAICLIPPPPRHCTDAARSLALLGPNRHRRNWKDVKGHCSRNSGQLVEWSPQWSSAVIVLAVAFVRLSSLFRRSPLYQFQLAPATIESLFSFAHVAGVCFRAVVLLLRDRDRVIRSHSHYQGFFVEIHIVILPLFPLPCHCLHHHSSMSILVCGRRRHSLATSVSPSVHPGCASGHASTRALPVVQFDGKTFLPRSLPAYLAFHSLGGRSFVPGNVLCRSTHRLLTIMPGARN